jgi:valyl-tRNA synthetase
MGHAMFATLQDISTRYHRMKGFDTLWLPGTDHAGLATQRKLEEAMLAEGLDPTDDTQFYPYSQNYKQNLKSTITGQLRRCGASADWSRETFTLDDRYSKATTEALKRCHEQGMLYEAEGQWYLDMTLLANRLLGELDQGNINIHPKGQEGTIRDFLYRIEPWCISRQIKWGHRLPIFTKNGEIKILDTSEKWKYLEFLDGGWTQAEGCLDTWFSSALWPFATLGWPEQTEDYKKFYPANMIETASDILFFWCARMLMMGLFLTDQLPFKTIYLHGLILDKDGKKMSKSEGNGIDPLELIETYGCDTMRFALAENTTPAMDMKLWDEKFKGAKSLCTKLWNASKFTLGQWDRAGRPETGKLTLAQECDRMIYKTALRASNEISEHLANLRYSDAAMCFRKFLFDDLCGFYLEISKQRLYNGDPEAINTLMWALDQTLRMSHPFIPFITERIRMAYSDTPLITDTWPDGDDLN